MFAPTIPPAVVTLETRLDEIYAELAISAKIEAGVGVTPPASDYALVWEFGNLRQHKKGPRTVRGTNLMTGAGAWMSSQAPTGYVRVNEPIFWNTINQGLSRVSFKAAGPGDIVKRLEAAANKMADSMAKTIKETAPIDTGALRDSVVSVYSGDPALSETPERFEGQVLRLNKK